MKTYHQTWDLRTIPDPQFASEAGRRRQRKRVQHGGGRPSIMQACPLCAAVMTAREMHRHYNAKTGKHRKVTAR